MISKSIQKLLYSTSTSTLREGKNLLVTNEVIVQFSVASGDKNPLHLDQQIAKKSIFKQRIAHGMLGVSLLEQILYNHYSKYNLKYLSCKFRMPVYLNDEIMPIFKQKSSSESKILFEYQIKKTKDKSVVIIGDGQLQINE